MQRSLLVVCALLGLSVAAAVAQHQAVDPAYLRQYYQQLAQQSGAAADATPIYEQNSEQSQQYVNPGQQLRVKDNVQEQIRAQQQQQQQQQHQQQQQQQYVAPAVREYLQHQQQPQQVQYHQPQQQQQQHQPQQVVYRQPQAVAAAPPRRAQPVHQYQAPAPKAKVQQQQQQQEEEEYDDQNSSYQFGFDVKDDEFTNYQNRKEVRDGSVIKGSYSVVDSDGFIRTVKYTADPKEGFKAEVIREPTDIVVKVPTPAPQQLLRTSPHGGHKAQEYASAKQQYQPQPQQQQQQQHYHQYQQ